MVDVFQRHEEPLLIAWKFPSVRNWDQGSKKIKIKKKWASNFLVCTDLTAQKTIFWWRLLRLEWCDYNSPCSSMIPPWILLRVWLFNTLIRSGCVFFVLSAQISSHSHSLTAQKKTTHRTRRNLLWWNRRSVLTSQKKRLVEQEENCADRTEKRPV